MEQPRKDEMMSRSFSFVDNEDSDNNSVDGTNSGEKRMSVHRKELAAGEEKAVARTRIIVVLVLLAVATAVAVSSYFILTSSEKTTFENAWEDEASKVLQSFQSSAARRVEAIDNFSKQITAYVLNQEGVEWPFVTVPHYEELGRSVIRLADVLDMIFHPVVSGADRKAYEQYVMRESGWIYDSLDVQRGDTAISDKWGHINRTQQVLDGQVQHMCVDLSYNVTVIDPLEIDPVGEMCPGLYGFPSVGGPPQLLPYDEPGPFVVNWQAAPFVRLPSVMNLNTLAFPNIAGPVKTSMITKQGALGPSVVLAGLTQQDQQLQRDYISLFIEFWEQDRAGDGEQGYQGFPNTVFWYPVFDKLMDFRANTPEELQESEVVAMLGTNVYWQTYFTNILPENSNGVVVVMANTCNQTYTFQVNGPMAEFLGEGDHHDASYEQYRIDATFDAFTTTSTEESLKHGACDYSIRIYPSVEFEDSYRTSTPIVYTVVLVALFVLTSAVFLMYDCLVERRQRVVADTAVKSTAIVQELFPQNVRDRLYDEKLQAQQPANEKKSKMDAFLNPEAMDANAKNGDPIADLFPNCTILFADIAGFTKWSSSRTPIEVFKLLEGIYGEMDKIAKRRKVFKIETIGDCYLAATGLPEPRKDHALAISVFAGECLRKVKIVIEEKLRHQLGDDTVDLSLRFGLHSGPVTAGVLRGEKSRFQVFGDTVNTASRMESTGVRDKIQVSEATAELIRSARKGSWLTQREDMIEAKGKGKMVTYWLNHRGALASSVAPSTVASTVDGSSDGNMPDIMETRRTPNEPIMESSGEKWIGDEFVMNCDEYVDV